MWIANKVKIIFRDILKGNYSEIPFAIGICVMSIFVTAIYAVIIIATKGEGSDFYVHNSIITPDFLATKEGLLLEPLYRICVFSISEVFNFPIQFASTLVISLSAMATILITRKILCTEIVKPNTSTHYAIDAIAVISVVIGTFVSPLTEGFFTDI